MKVLIDHSSPFLLAEGGVQMQIEQTKTGLERIGCEVDYLRWWDLSARPDLIHFFGVPPLSYIRHCRARSLPVVMTQPLSATCNRPRLKLLFQALLVRLFYHLPGWRSVRDQTSWPVFREVDHIVVGLEAERNVLETVFGVNRNKITVVPLGVDEAFLHPSPRPSVQFEHLICVGAILPVKRSLELAKLALESRVPILFVGKPFSESDPYWQEFKTKIDGVYVIYKGGIDSREQLAALMRQSRGFVHYSHWENWCLAANEAVACGLPLLLPDKPWAKERFGKNASYFHPRDHQNNIQRLQVFFNASSSLAAPPTALFSWDDISWMLLKVYQQVCLRR